MTEKQRSSVVTLRVSPAEQESLRRAAAASNMSLSEYLRTRLMGAGGSRPGPTGVTTSSGSTTAISSAVVHGGEDIAVAGFAWHVADADRQVSENSHTLTFSARPLRRRDTAI